MLRFVEGPGKYGMYNGQTKALSKYADYNMDI